MSEPTPVADQAEFKQAVANEVAAILAKMGAPTQEAPDHGFVEGLALAIANISNQGVGKTQVVSPQVVKNRNDARARMMSLIVMAHQNGEIPTYKLINKCYLGEQLIEPKWIDSNHVVQSTEIDYRLVPNTSMVPVNDIANKIHAAFLESIGTKQSDIQEPALRVTPAGVVVRDGRRRDVPDVGSEAPRLDDGGLRIKHKVARYKEINILGTVAEPAREQV